MGGSVEEEAPRDSACGGEGNGEQHVSMYEVMPIRSACATDACVVNNSVESGLAYVPLDDMIGYIGVPKLRSAAHLVTGNPAIKRGDLPACVRAVERNVAPDKAGSAGHEYPLQCCVPSAVW